MSETENAVKSDLEQLAVRKFGQLTEAEKKLVHAAATGGQANCGPDGKGPNAPENAPAQATSWGSERQIRAELIAWLCVDRDAVKLTHVRGLTVACAKIIGKLDLSAFTVPFPLIFFQCCFCEESCVESEWHMLLSERDHALNVLSQCSGNVTEAARRLGVSRMTIYRRIRNWQISLAGPRER